MTQLIDGKKVSETILEKIKDKIKSHPSGKPGLAFLLIGNHAPSHTYVKMKQKACALVGIESFPFFLEETITQEALLTIIEKLNNDPKVHGILVQQPLPQHLNTEHIVSAVSPEKDVDGFHPLNMGKILLDQKGGFLPCTPYGILELFKYYDIETKGKHIVILGRSHIVGKPLAALLLQKSPLGNATVSVCHSKTTNLSSITKTADILIAAIGQPHFVTGDMVREGVIIIDVGINRSPLSKKIVGDVDFVSVKEKAKCITPVPGGVGPMTIAMLLSNTLESFLKKTTDLS